MTGCYPGCYYYTDSCFRKDCMKTQVSSPAAVDALPKPTLLRRVIPDGYWYGDVYGYTAEQMQAVIAAEREKRGFIKDVQSAFAAVATLKSLGYTYHGGEQWKPPLGKKPDFDLIAALRTELATLRAPQEAQPS